MSLSESMFGYLPDVSEERKRAIGHVNEAAEQFADVLNVTVPDGPDKTYLMRKLREVVMWANTSIVRHTDGSPRK